MVVGGGARIRAGGIVPLKALFSSIQTTLKRFGYSKVNFLLSILLKGEQKNYEAMLQSFHMTLVPCLSMIEFLSSVVPASVLSSSILTNCIDIMQLSNDNNIIS